MVESVTLTLLNADATRKLGVTLGRSLSGGSTLLLNGDLGSGKTTLIQGIAAGLGIAEPVVSPTFNLINEYFEGRVPLYHFDLYRLDSSDVATLTPELYWEGIEYPPGIVAIEWAERLPYYPEHYLQISLKHDAAGRQISLIAQGIFESELAHLIALKL